MILTRKASVLSMVSILLVAGAVFLGNQRQAYAEEASLGEQIVCDVFDELAGIPLPPGAECEEDNGGGDGGGDGGGPNLPPEVTQCNDGIDNDGDGLMDFLPVVGDPGCVDIYDNDEGTDSCPTGQHWGGSACVPDEEPVDVCSNIDGAQATVPQGYHLEDGQCVEDVVVTDMCPNIDGVQETVPEGKEIKDGNCVDKTTGGGGETPTNGGGAGGGYAQASYGGGGGNGPIAGASFAYPIAPAALVLGSASTSETLSCDQYLTAFIKPQGTANDVEQVKRLQSFLNEFEGTSLEVSGIYDASTVAAVHAFQTKHADTILTPWGLKKSTGFVFLTTRKAVNEIRCAKYGTTFPLTAEETTYIALNKETPVAPAAPKAPAAPAPAAKPKAPAPKDMKGESMSTTTSAAPKEAPVQNSWSPLRNLLRSIFNRD